MKEEYVDIKISTLVKKMDKYLKERKIPELQDQEFWNTIKISVDMFLTENGYPFYAVINDMNRIMAIKMDNEATVFEIRIRYDISKKRPISERTYSFKALVKAGPCFNMTVSEAVGRRVYGISYKLDELSYDAEKLGYTSVDEMVKEYENAKKIVDKLQIDKASYDSISEKEKAKYRKLDCTVQQSKQKMVKIWSLHNETQAIYAVSYGVTLQDAVKRTCREINANKRTEYTRPGLWNGEEFTIKKYGGVLLYT